MRGLLRCQFVAVAALALIGAVTPARADKRVALVVGNSAYQNTQVLQNPVNDAEDIAAALKTVGFTVMLERNLSKRGLEGAIARFARLAQDADTALVFYAGHGMQFRGQNYLMPTDAKLEDEFSLSFELNKIDDVMVGLDRARGVKILILDACRNNPLAERLSRAATTRDFYLTRGLAKIEPTRGMVIAYSTQPNQVALDGTGRNSPFARALVKEIDQPGLEIGALFRRVARSVNDETAGKQLPETSVSLIGDFYLNAKETDLQAWARTRVSSSSADYRDFIRSHPKSIFAPDARQQLDALERAERARAEQVERERVQREQAARAEEERKRLAREQGEREQAARFEAERKRLAEEQAARDRAQREEVARAEAERARVREQAEREQQAKLEAERQRLAEQAAREKAEPSAAAAPPTQLAMVTPPAEPVPQPVATVAALSGGALVQEIKKELKRVGCYGGRIDEKWSTAGQAIRKFARQGKLSIVPNGPTADLLDTLRGHSARVCPLECGLRETERDGQCVAKSCPTGQILGNDGHCTSNARSASRGSDVNTEKQLPKGGKAAACSEFKNEIGCRCAVQVGGWVSSDNWSHGGNGAAHIKCLTAHGVR